MVKWGGEPVEAWRLLDGDWKAEAMDGVLAAVEKVGHRICTVRSSPQLRGMSLVWTWRSTVSMFNMKRLRQMKRARCTHKLAAQASSPTRGIVRVRCALVASGKVCQFTGDDRRRVVQHAGYVASPER